jgi:hypothetical protein
MAAMRGGGGGEGGAEALSLRNILTTREEFLETAKQRFESAVMLAAWMT